MNLALNRLDILEGYNSEDEEGSFYRRQLIKAFTDDNAYDVYAYFGNDSTIFDKGFLVPSGVYTGT